ncbi:hypothetical protein [Paenibacillus contaminans]|uniref:Uncharacterized protein n=1 Tax=Paenibacillus contaminans TaxID=450362 RepID=A0A329MRU5_9BACL|nr:hypothetical protein [Paenibacillus contaminans]RAV22655.1 hypothetical protein DQG23_00090 [Paenibacillus contaminans]
MAKLVLENHETEQLTEAGHTLYITVKHFTTHSIFLSRVVCPSGQELLNIRSWQVLPHMFVQLKIYKEYNKKYELGLLKEVIQEIGEAWKDEYGCEPVWEF